MNALKKALTAVVTAAVVAVPVVAVAASPAAATSWNDVKIEQVQYRGAFEFVKLRNTAKSGLPVNISGWKLRNHMNQTKYVFPGGSVLPAGRAVYVKTVSSFTPNIPGSWVAEQQNFVTGFNLWRDFHGKVTLSKNFGGTQDTCNWNGGGAQTNVWC